ncbi:hypothetical protein [Clostridium sp. Marseille-P2415]|uniref:hypothetical protein n=1 Tax=Clostridium sp. Marseille-P2415 TaxID=1805471 RepID=UPI0011155C29|nr:hypothetical protein [Clostridium sp. Marseille-P2415]
MSVIKAIIANATIAYTTIIFQFLKLSIEGMSICPGIKEKDFLDKIKKRLTRNVKFTDKAFFSFLLFLKRPGKADAALPSSA